MTLDVFADLYDDDVEAVDERLDTVARGAAALVLADSLWTEEGIRVVRSSPVKL